MEVEDLMTSPVYRCSPRDSLHAAAQIMWDADCGCVVVVDDERLVGMITDRDICMAAHFTGAPLDSTTVDEVMSRTIYACKPNDTITTASQLMREAQLRRLPVAD